MRKSFLLISAFAWCIAGLAATVGFRVDGTSRFPDAAPQTTWATNQRVVWATPLAKWSNASPIIVGDRIFICAEPATLVCLNKADGSILWEQANEYDAFIPEADRAPLDEERAKVAELNRQLRPLRGQLRTKQNELKNAPNDEALKAAVAALNTQITDLQKQINGYELAKQWQMPAAHATNGYSSATPTSDGKSVYVLFGNGVAASYDLDGKLRWRRLLEKPTHEWGWCASPLLVGNIVVAQYNRNVYGLNVKTGETTWKAQATHQWGSPQYIRIGPYDAVVTASALVFNAADGKPLVKLPSKALDYNSALVQDGIIFYVQTTTVAMKPVVKADGTVAIEKLWEAKINDDRYYASSLLHDGLLYAINQKSVFSVLDAKDGSLVYEQKLNLGGTTYPSFVLAGNVIILSSDNGKSIVIEPGREYKEVARNTFEAFRTTPVLEGKRMYIRGLRNMYCIGE